MDRPTKNLKFHQLHLLPLALSQWYYTNRLDKEPMPMVRKRPRYESEKKAPKRGSKLVAAFQKNIALLALAAFQKNINLVGLSSTHMIVDHKVYYHIFTKP
ncbi:hypothetical protein SLA2020_199260 [Shorea laevis]